MRPADREHICDGAISVMIEAASGMWLFYTRKLLCIQTCVYTNLYKILGFR